MQAWYQTLTGTRCSNSAECRNKRPQTSEKPGVGTPQKNAEEIEKLQQEEIKEMDQKRRLQPDEGRRGLTSIEEEYVDNSAGQGNTYVNGDYRVSYI